MLTGLLCACCRLRSSARLRATSARAMYEPARRVRTRHYRTVRNRRILSFAMAPRHSFDQGDEATRIVLHKSSTAQEIYGDEDTVAVSTSTTDAILAALNASLLTERQNVAC
jgi:hypothetical protein